MASLWFTVGVTILHLEFGRDVLFLSQPVALTVGGVIIIGLIANFNSLIGLLSSLILMLLLFGAQLLFSLLHLESFAWEMGAYVISVVGLLVMMSFRKQLPKTVIKG